MAGCRPCYSRNWVVAGLSLALAFGLAATAIAQQGQPASQDVRPAVRSIGGDEPRFLHTETSLVADTRDYPDHPTSGALLRVAGARFDDQDTGLHSFQRFESATWSSSGLRSATPARPSATPHGGRRERTTSSPSNGPRSSWASTRATLTLPIRARTVTWLTIGFRRPTSRGLATGLAG